MRTLVVSFALLSLFVLPAGASAPWAWERPATAAHAMVATEQHLATRAGVDVLRTGGNAVDAAIAIAYALAVVDPCCGNIGGGGFILLRMHDGRERFIDFREKAPLRASAHMYLDRTGAVVRGASTKGYLAAGVPGTVMGLERARTEFGTFSRGRLMAPAIALARDGFRIVRGDDVPVATDRSNVRAIFMPQGRSLRPGDLLKQPQLAVTLSRIARGGAGVFYRGPIARAIVTASNQNGGILSLKDFASYDVRETAPVHCTYRGYTIASSAPPSSGGVTLCEILNVLSAYPMRTWGWHSTRALHYAIEAERRAFADRNAYLGDPSFVRNPVSQLLSAAYAARLRSTIAADRATPSHDVHPGLGSLARENPQTTHFSVVDRWGNAVALTYTINDSFGAGVIAGSTGFFLNDEMDDFTSKPGVPNLYGLVQGRQNAIAPGKRPLSSMAPTIVTRNGKLVMVTGSPGGSKIITIVLETLQNAIDYDMNVQAAVDAPRVHMQWLPDRVNCEPGAIQDSTRAALQRQGYSFAMLHSWGSAQAIEINPVSGRLYGGTDRRRPAGLALGY